VDANEAETAAQAELDHLLDKTTLGTMTNNELEEQFRQLEAETEGQPSKSPQAEPSSEEPIATKPRIRIE
jgi:hypothetical protein